MRAFVLLYFQCLKENCKEKNVSHRLTRYGSSIEIILIISRENIAIAGVCYTNF